MPDVKHQEVKTSVVDIWVSDHARERARERIPGFKAARIIDEVRAAIRYGRISQHKRPWMTGRPYHASLYVWTEDDSRCYPLKCADNGFVVCTTVVRTA